VHGDHAYFASWHFGLGEGGGHTHLLAKYDLRNGAQVWVRESPMVYACRRGGSLGGGRTMVTVEGNLFTPVSWQCSGADELHVFGLVFDTEGGIVGEPIEALFPVDGEGGESASVYAGVDHPRGRMVFAGYTFSGGRGPFGLAVGHVGGVAWRRTYGPEFVVQVAFLGHGDQILLAGWNAQDPWWSCIDEGALVACVP